MNAVSHIFSCSMFTWVALRGTFLEVFLCRACMPDTLVVRLIWCPCLDMGLMHISTCPESNHNK